MIAIERDRDAIPARFLGEKRRKDLLSLFKAILDDSIKTKSVKDKLLTSSKWSPAKSQLSKETHGKCAFCDAPTMATNYGDVEHYRPKSKFNWFAYCYDNFLLSCRLCNAKKSNHFQADQEFVDPVPPWDADATPTATEILDFALSVEPDPTDQSSVDDYLALCLDEGIHIPNPYYEDPETLFTWTADDLLQEVRIAPIAGSDRSEKVFAGAEEFLDLNRPELLTQRYFIYMSARSIITRNKRDRDNGIPITDEDEQAEAMLTADRFPFAGMVRFFADGWL